MLSRAPATVRRLAALLLVVGLGLAPLAAIAGFGVDRPLADPALERRALELNKELRCLVCQNQSIADSNAPLARDLRDVVRERVAAGDSDRQVLDYLVARYGDWVLLAPPFIVEERQLDELIGKLGGAIDAAVHARVAA